MLTLTYSDQDDHFLLWNAADSVKYGIFCKVRLTLEEMLFLQSIAGMFGIVLVESCDE